MKYGLSISLLGLAAVISGCATQSQVQEAIDANHKDFLAQIETHEASINVLKQSAVAGLEKSKENAVLLKEQQEKLDEIIAQLKLIESYAEASKVNSAANTVKLDMLDKGLKANSEADAETAERLKEIDKLYEEILIAHYKKLAESANQAAATLQSRGWQASTNGPVDLNEPIEIVAPDTTIIPTDDTLVEETVME